MVAAQLSKTSSNAERIAFILSDRWVPYAQGAAALGQLTELLRGAQRIRMPSLLMVGEPDIGKTTIIRKFMRGHPPEFNAELGTTHSPVIAMEAPPEADERRLYSAILDAMGAPAPGGRTEILERAVYAQMRRLGTRLLLIDETNNLVIGSANAQRRTLAAVRRLANQLSLSIAFVGTMEALNAITSDPQTEGRAQPFRLGRLQNDTDFAKMVRAVVAHYPLRMDTPIEPLFVALVHELSSGSPGKVYRLLNVAAVRSIDNGDERITPELLRNDDITRHIQTAAAMRRGMKAGAVG